MSRTSTPYRPPDPSSSPSAVSRSISYGPWVIGALVVLLLVLHQDNWLWTDRRLVLGVMPVGMAWHVCISIGAAVTWFLATLIAWPVREDSADSTPNKGDQ